MRPVNSLIDHVTIALAAYVLQTYCVDEISPLNPTGGLLPRQCLLSR
jgi:hypothetical protein